MTKARRLRLRGPKTRLEKFLTWKKGPMTTERLAILLIVCLCYVNAQMLLAIYSEENDMAAIDNGPRIDLGFNPIAHHELSLKRGDTRNAPFVPDKQSDVEPNGAGGDPVVLGRCPDQVSCQDRHVHIYAESGPRRSKVCLNGNEVLLASKAAAGINIVVINPARGTAGSVHNFDSFQNSEMVEILESLNEERIVVMVAQEDASISLSPESRLAIEKLGSTLIHDLGWRSSWAFVGQVGISTISPYEAMKSTEEEWAIPAAVSQCIPYKIDDESVLTESRKDFCDTYDNYGEFCKRSWEKPRLLAPENQLGVSSFPIAIIAGDRGPYLRQSLSSLFKAPGLIPENVIVFQGGHSPEVLTIVQQFGVRLVQFLKPNTKVSKGLVNEADHIATNYKRTFDVVWGVNPKKAMYPDKEFMIVLEDDVTVSNDFFDYFDQLVSVLETDKTLFAVSAWNDNGYPHVSHDPSVVYRTEFFPGLGWMLPQRSWRMILEPAWPKCCHGISWDVELRKVLKRRGLDCVFPDVSRTHHIGKSGVGKSRQHALADGTHHTLTALDRLEKESYRELLFELLTKAEVVDHSVDPCKEGFILESNKILTIFYYQKDITDTSQVLALAVCLHLWNAENVRGLFEGVLRTHYHGNQLLLVGSLGEYSEHFMPRSVQPFKIFNYKDDTI